jgi:hypothetical protein
MKIGFVRDGIFEYGRENSCVMIRLMCERHPLSELSSAKEIMSMVA